MTGTVAQTIETKLRTAFAPDFLEVIDDSARHRGHAGWREGGQTHFKVAIRAAAFNGQNRVARQRMIYRALAEELAGPIHALELSVDGTEA